MIKINTYIQRPAHAALKQISEETGITVAELIRRALDTYLETRKGAAK